MYRMLIFTKIALGVKIVYYKGIKSYKAISPRIKKIRIIKGTYTSQDKTLYYGIYAYLWISLFSLAINHLSSMILQALALCPWWTLTCWSLAWSYQHPDEYCFPSTVLPKHITIIWEAVNSPSITSSLKFPSFLLMLGYLYLA